MAKRRTYNTMAKRRTYNTMAKRRTDNTQWPKEGDNTMAKRKRTKRQTMIYKTSHRKLKIEQHKFHKNLGLNSCSTRCTHPVTLVKNLTVMNEERMGLLLRQAEHICGRLFTKGWW
jgi:hypothetical protein